MEVHHHSHTPRKKWSHYFWEFLMLFLAVTLGFFVENQREHFIEHKREVQYIKSFIEDLRLDTIAYNGQIRQRTLREKGIDSLIFMLKSADRDQYLNSIYHRGMQLGRGGPFQYNDRTIQQLKNSGGMRLIRKQDASDSIMSYDATVRNMQYFQSQAIEAAGKYRDIAGYIFDASVFHSMIDERNENSVARPEGNPKLLTEDPEIINRLCMCASYFRTTNHQIITNQTNLKNQAVRLMELLKKEYTLE